jgi:hypothetical protein
MLVASVQPALCSILLHDVPTVPAAREPQSTGCKTYLIHFAWLFWRC